MVFLLLVEKFDPQSKSIGLIFCFHPIFATSFSLLNLFKTISLQLNPSHMKLLILDAYIELFEHSHAQSTQ